MNIKVVDGNNKQFNNNYTKVLIVIFHLIRLLLCLSQVLIW